jgi:hypothetical protein
VSPSADERALAWAKALADDILAGRERDWLDRVEGTTVDVRCRACDQLVLTLTPEGQRAAVLPVDDAHLGTRFVPDTPRASTGQPLTTYERVKIVCTCGIKSPSVKASKLAPEYLYALASDRDLIWPPD